MGCAGFVSFTSGPMLLGNDLFWLLLIKELVYMCSAIGQFKKQFAHLEENSGRSGPVIPLERKHISLPRYRYSFLLLVALDEYFLHVS